MNKCKTYPARNHETVLNTFITPNEQVVKETAEYIVGGLIRDSIADRVAAAFNFVAVNIVYTSDRKQFGKNDWWQYPLETLGQVFTDGNVARLYGDCEDSSFLLASLLIAMGVPSRNVRVGISDVHAWIECKIANTWFLFETTDDREMNSFTTAKSIVGKGYVYDVQVYVYQEGCIYGRR